MLPLEKTPNWCECYGETLFTRSHDHQLSVLSNVITIINKFQVNFNFPAQVKGTLTPVVLHRLNQKPVGRRRMRKARHERANARAARTCPRLRVRGCAGEGPGLPGLAQPIV